MGTAPDSRRGRGAAGSAEATALMTPAWRPRHGAPAGHTAGCQRSVLGPAGDPLPRLRLPASLPCSPPRARACARGGRRPRGLQPTSPGRVGPQKTSPCACLARQRGLGLVEVHAQQGGLAGGARSAGHAHARRSKQGHHAAPVAGHAPTWGRTWGRAPARRSALHARLAWHAELLGSRGAVHLLQPAPAEARVRRTRRPHRQGSPVIPRTRFRLPFGTPTVSPRVPPLLTPPPAQLLKWRPSPCRSSLYLPGPRAPHALEATGRQGRGARQSPGGAGGCAHPSSRPGRAVLSRKGTAVVSAPGAHPPQHQLSVPAAPQLLVELGWCCLWGSGV